MCGFVLCIQTVCDVCRVMCVYLWSMYCMCISIWAVCVVMACVCGLGVVCVWCMSCVCIGIWVVCVVYEVCV